MKRGDCIVSTLFAARQATERCCCCCCSSVLHRVSLLCLRRISFTMQLCFARAPPHPCRVASMHRGHLQRVSSAKDAESAPQSVSDVGQVANCWQSAAQQGTPPLFCERLQQCNACCMQAIDAARVRLQQARLQRIDDAQRRVVELQASICVAPRLQSMTIQRTLCVTHGNRSASQTQEHQLTACVLTAAGGTAADPGGYPGGEQWR
jgi:hypothetical protein